MNDARRARLRELQAQHRYSDALEVALPELSALLGLELTDDDAVSMEAAAEALAASLAQDRFRLVWHRTWGVRLRAEVVATCSRLGDALAGERAVLLWHRSTAAFLVPVDVALRTLPGHIGPPEDSFGESGEGSDVVLVSADGESGLRLEFNHLPGADEYELRSWGRYAIAVP